MLSIQRQPEIDKKKEAGLTEGEYISQERLKLFVMDIGQVPVRGSGFRLAPTPTQLVSNSGRFSSESIEAMFGIMFRQ